VYSNVAVRPFQHRLAAVYIIVWNLHINYSFKYTKKMQRYTTFFITVNALHAGNGLYTMLVTTLKDSKTSKHVSILYQL